MKAVIIDDERHALEEISILLKQNGAEVIGAFTLPEQGYEFILKEKPDAVFLDIEMPNFNGLELGILIQNNLPEIMIVYITAYSEYSLEAFKAYPLDYIMKPVNEERFAKTVEYIKKKLMNNEEMDTINAEIKCFGRFETLVDRKPIKFQTQKTKELFAFLIGCFERPVYKDEIVNLIFGTGDPKRDANNFRVALYRLRNTLMTSSIKKDQILIREDCTIFIQDGICDYIDFMRFNGRCKAIEKSNLHEAMRIIDTINGEFMSDIEAVWACELREELSVKAENLMIMTALYCMNTEKKPLKAEKILLRLVENNPLSEPGYHALLELYISAGNREKYDYHYRRYAKMMQEEFCCEPEKLFHDFFINK